MRDGTPKILRCCQLAPHALSHPRRRAGPAPPGGHRHLGTGTRLRQGWRRRETSPQSSEDSFSTLGSSAHLFGARLVCILLSSCDFSALGVNGDDSEDAHQDLSESRRTDRHLVLPCFKELFASGRYPDQKIKGPGTASPAAMFRGFPKPPSARIPYISLCLGCILLTPTSALILVPA